MARRQRWASAIVVVGIVGGFALLHTRAIRSTTPAEPTGATAENAVTPDQPTAPSAPAIALPAVGAAADDTAPPAPSGKVRITVNDREQYEEASNVIAYFREKELPKHGPVRRIGDGIDSTDRNAKLPPDTTFARFRYEYEKHDSDRLMSDLSWADGELAKLHYEERKANGTLSEEERTQGELLTRRRQALVSILAQRAREEELHDRYQRVEVIYQDPNEAKSNGGG